MLEKILKTGKKIIPKKIFRAAQPLYHYALALIGALIYRFPGKKITVIGITGTKGKTTTAEMVNAILEEAGVKTALASTLRFKIGEKDERNLFKMTMPGRFFVQRFLRSAVEAGCTHAILEMTSEGAKQFRHKFTYPGVIIFTNLAPEHIESHGSYENYLKAKLSIARELEGRPDGVIVANVDDQEGEKFLALGIKSKVPYSLGDAVSVKADDRGSSFQIGKIVVHSKLPGIFNVSNMLGAVAYARFAGLPDEKIKKGLEKLDLVRGRMEKITVPNPAAGEFEVVVDYAHTPDSLRSVYETYNPSARSGQAKHKLICVLGSTGGGRDRWKREEMGKIADKYCNQIILTDEDPYDEDPLEIIEDLKKGIKKKPCEIILDRREAIRLALGKAQGLAHGKPSEITKVAVLITGKGTDPYIMGPNGSRTPWDDAAVAREELHRILDIRH